MSIRPLRYALPLVLACALVGVVGASATPTASPVTVKSAASETYGNLIVTAGGLSLYHLNSEKKGTIACSGGCAKAWPPLLVATGVKPTAGTGIAAAKLGTIKRPDGRMQLTYNGLALYRFASDKKPGDLKGEDVSDWYLVTAAGKIAKPASGEDNGTATTPAQAPATTTTPAAGGGDQGYSY